MLLLCYAFCITKKQIFVVFSPCKIPSSAFRKRIFLSREAELLTRVTSRFSRPAVTRRIASTTTPRRSFKLSRSRKRDYRKVKDLVRYLPMYTRANTSITSAIQTQILKLRLRNSFYRRVAVLLLVVCCCCCCCCCCCFGGSFLFCCGFFCGFFLFCVSAAAGGGGAGADGIASLL